MCSSVRHSLVMVALLIWLWPAVFAVETLRPEELRPGMKGYGLSVFRGREPEKFNVEVVGVLKNSLPKQDMILIRMSGQNLETTKCASGMSGSPIYIEDKLIGALAYSWSFMQEPIAGVTPIHNMLAQLERPVAPPKGPQGAMWPTEFSPVVVLGEMARIFSHEAIVPRRLISPLILTGFSTAVIEHYRKDFERFGMQPVAAAGGSGPQKLPRGRLKPGSAIGLRIVGGDVSAVVYGTVSYVDGDKALAFGHPFFEGGRMSAPAVSAEVNHVLASVSHSFKMSTPVADVGVVVGDWQPGIVLDCSADAVARTIPMTVTVSNRDTGQKDKFSMELMENPNFSAYAARMALSQAVDATTGASEDNTIRVVSEMLVGERKVRFDNLFFNARGNVFDPSMVWQVSAVFNSPFGFPDVKEISVQADVTLSRRTAEIKRAYFTQPSLRRGEKAELRVVLKPFGQPELTRSVEIEVPVEYTEPTLPVFVIAGLRASSEAAPPENLDDYLDALEKGPRTTDLVVIVPRPALAMRYRGKVLRDLPPSALNVLVDQTVGLLARDLRRTIVSTDWVLFGSAGAVAPIKDE